MFIFVAVLHRKTESITTIQSLNVCEREREETHKYIEENYIFKFAIKKQQKNENMADKQTSLLLY